MKLLLSPKAANDLEEIGDFIARDNPNRAVSFLEELFARCLRISEAPDCYPRRDDIADGLRIAVHGNYLILFRTENNAVRIERIVHSARRWEELI